MALNFELLVSTVKWARYEYERGLAGEIPMWNQSSWLNETDCGTQACIAGRVVLDAGYVGTPNWDAYVRWQPGCPVKPDLDSDVPVSGLAQVLLGITELEACRLFYSQNTVDDVELHAREIAAAYGYEWPVD